jgi:transcriptional regulator with XRE-family HTH domain
VPGERWQTGPVDVAELGPFLRSRREAVLPADVGLPTGTRRRTPGLRRAELATLAGISVDYLVRLEQGRDRHPSAQVLAALADALGLGESDRDFLRRFSIVTNGRELCPNVPVPATTVRPNIQRTLDRLAPSPAYVLNRLSDVLAWNAAFDRFARPLGMLDADRPNLARFTFTDRGASTAFPDWGAVADEQVATLRAETWTEDPFAAALLDELTAAGRDFTDRWTAQPTVRKPSSPMLVAHPEVGELRVAFETMRLSDEDGQRLVVYLPADDATERALDQLAGRFPGALRSVEQAAS